jgi:hypothetical protein
MLVYSLIKNAFFLGVEYEKLPASDWKRRNDGREIELFWIPNQTW